MSNSVPKPVSRLQCVFPDAYLMLFMVIGFADLLSTFIWHSNGQIIELNPLLRPIIERSEWLFAVVKGSTLVMAYLTMAWYARKKPEFVRKASRVGITVYLLIYFTWFLSAL